MKFILDLPDELVTTLNSLGYSPLSFFQAVFIAPLLTHYKKDLETKILNNNKAEVDKKVNSVTANSDVKTVEDNDFEAMQVEIAKKPKKTGKN